MSARWSRERAGAAVSARAPPPFAELPRPGERPFHVALAAVAAGLALGASDPAYVLAAGLGGGVLVGALRAPRLGALVGALVLAGAALGELRLNALDGPAAGIDDGEAVQLRAHLLTAPRPSPVGATAEIRVTGGPKVSTAGGPRTGGPSDGTRLLLRLPRWAPLPAAARPGMELAVEGRTAARRRSGLATMIRTRGIAGELYADEVRLTGKRRAGLAGVLDRMRARAQRAVAAGMRDEDAALLRGMVLGQDEWITPAVRDDFRASGLAHLLAVSGQNVMLLAALALPLLMLAGAGVRTRLVVIAGLIALYVPLAGAGPSLQRAGIMGLAGIAAMAASRPASRWYALLLAAAGTLAWNPRAWEDPGWQLSFAAVVGILVIGVPLRRGLRRAAGEVMPERGHPAERVIGALADGVAITVAATIATAPLLAHHFDAISPASLPANVLALPAVAPAMWLGMLKIALGQLAAAGALGHAIATPLAAGLGSVAGLPVGLIASFAERFADLPGGQLVLSIRSPLALGGAYLAVAAAALFAWMAVTALSPRLLGWSASWRALPARRRAAWPALTGAAVTLAAGCALARPSPPDHLAIRFLDVGQGDATLVQHPGGAAILFDGGPPEAGTARLLRKAGVRRLALVVATHASRDHHGGLAEVLRRFPVDALLDGGDGSRDPGFRAVLQEAAARGIRRIAATAPLDLALGGGALRVRVLSPEPRPAGPVPEDPNPRAVVAVVSAGAFDMLLSADAESETLRRLDLPDVEAMKVPHHGSSDPGLRAVLGELRPELAAIEVGPNTYGHPHPSTLSALRRASVTTYRTDRDGTVTLSLTDGEAAVETAR